MGHVTMAAQSIGAPMSERFLRNHAWRLSDMAGYFSSTGPNEIVSGTQAKSARSFLARSQAHSLMKVAPGSAASMFELVERCGIE